MGADMAVSAALALRLFVARFCCRSSVVEHPLGKGEVECSIHSGSTIFTLILLSFRVLWAATKIAPI